MKQKYKGGKNMAYTLYTSIKAKSISYGGNRVASSIKYIVIHYTANKTDKAINNAKYYRDTNTRAAGAHYFVDDTSIYQSIDDLKSAYAVGGSKFSNCTISGGGTMYGKITNSNSISIEMCSTNSKITNATIDNTAELVKKLMAKYKIPATNVYRHFDVTGKACPSSLYTGSWNSADTWIGKNPTQWNKLKSKLTTSTVENYIYQNVNYNKVFNHIFYADANPDLKNTFGYDKTKLFNHFINYGCKEASRYGKTISTFNVLVYASHSPDLVKAFGALTQNNAILYYKHYCEYGYKENRRAI